MSGSSRTRSNTRQDESRVRRHLMSLRATRVKRRHAGLKACEELGGILDNRMLSSEDRRHCKAKSKGCAQQPASLVAVCSCNEDKVEKEWGWRRTRTRRRHQRRQWQTILIECVMENLFPLGSMTLLALSNKKGQTHTWKHKRTLINTMVSAHNCCSLTIQFLFYGYVCLLFVVVTLRCVGLR